jgi:sugar-specific transcriptional regulator TrmB
VVTVERSELVDVLEEAGLSPYQADAYVAILELGAAPATDIVKASNVPDPRIYDVLRDLESAGYVELYEQDSLHARAYDLETVRSDLETRATRFTDAATEIERRWEEPAIDEGVVSIVKRFETVLNKADEFIRSANNQVEASMSPDHYRRLRPALKTAKDNGASVKLSLFTDDGTGPEALPPVEDVSEVASEVRYRDLPSPFVVTVDRTKACFVPHAGSANVYGILVDDRTHTYVFHWFFLTTQWDIWESYYRESTENASADYIDIRYCVRDVAPLLDEGATVRVRVDGYDTETGRDRTVEGTVSEVIVSGSKHEATDQIATYGGQVAILLETDDGEVEVGGWGAMIEEIEAHRMQILSVE